MDNKFYLITLTENVKYNDIVTARTHKGVVIGDYRKACELQKKALYDRLHYWMEMWGYNEEGCPLEEIFEVAKGLNKFLHGRKMVMNFCVMLKSLMNFNLNYFYFD